MGRNKETLLRKFHEARWDEELIMEMSVPGERGVLVPKASNEVKSCTEGTKVIPKQLRRTYAPELPEVNQMRVVRHFTRLSQETMGCDVAADISQGTCTMKYSPKFQEQIFNRNPNFIDIHPLQDESTIQGTLQIYHEFEKMLCEISGMDCFTFQPGGGAGAIFVNSSIVRAYHRDRADFHKDEIITSIYAHPTNAACPHNAGFKIVTVMPKENGLPDFEAFKAAVNERTAAFFITNPEDTGIFNPDIDKYVDLVHSVGGLCVYDQANANSIMGITRAREAGFDMCHFNLHKTFSAPKGGMGPACGAAGVRSFLKKYLPYPWVEYDGDKYHLNYDCPDSIGKIRSFFGNLQLVAKSYSWIRQLGVEGIREAAITAVMNNQYLFKKLSETPGITIYYGENTPRLCQARYSWEELTKDTGVDTYDILRRLIDYGAEHYFPAHHPWMFPEAWSMEPCEAYNLDDIEEHIAIIRQIIKECYENPELVKNAPYNAPIHNIPEYYISDPEKVYSSWRQYKRKTGKGNELRAWEKDIDWMEIK